MDGTDVIANLGIVLLASVSDLLLRHDVVDFCAETTGALVKKRFVKTRLVKTRFVEIWSMPFFGEKCWGKIVMVCTEPQQRKEESEKLRGERDQIKFIDFRFERWQVVGLSELC